mmetsp:Transcript_7070/g.8949  ORF Transcript_7070/g.8949 Transcript_7070/m.8949 type:complete len:324 (+) Transcript_7070:395-1366(+)
MPTIGGILTGTMSKVSKDETDSVFDFTDAEEQTLEQLRHRLAKRGAEERWIIPREEITLSEELTVGSFGSLYRSKWRQLDCIARTYPGKEFFSLKHMGNEISVLSSLRHPNVVMFLGACFAPDNTILIMEYCSGGNLSAFLKGRKGKKLNQIQAYKTVRDLALAMNFLRNSNVIHRSLNPTCILLTKSGSVKVGNFGSSRFCEPGTILKDGFSHKPQCEAFKYQCPEFLNKVEYSHNSDVYSFALVSYYVLTSVEPYSELQDADEFVEAVTAGKRPNLDKVKEKFLKELLQRCWTSDRKSRIPFPQVVAQMEKHPQHYKCKVQ